MFWKKVVSYGDQLWALTADGRVFDRVIVYPPKWVQTAALPHNTTVVDIWVHFDHTASAQLYVLGSNSTVYALCHYWGKSGLETAWDRVAELPETPCG